MLSEEEIIKEIEIIKETQDIMQHNLDTYPPKEDIYKLDTKQLKAVICLLDLYKKEKEKNALLLANNNGYFDLKKYIKNNYIRKDKIREKIKNIEDIYKKEMKPYQTEYGLNVSLLSKKEKEELINKRNGLLTQKITLEELLEEN